MSICLQKLKNKFIEDVSRKYPNCDKISIVRTQSELEQITDNARLNEQTILSTQMRDGSFLVVTFNTRNLDTQLFKSLSDDSRQIYIMDENNHLLASHNFTRMLFKETLDMLPTDMIIEDPCYFRGRKK